MIIKFIVDYRGKLTNETYYLKGAVIDHNDGQATRLIADGRAEEATTAQLKSYRAAEAKRRKEAKK